eukprot:2673179-Rhodomonas_salina.1
MGSRSLAALSLHHALKHASQLLLNLDTRQATPPLRSSSQLRPRMVCRDTRRQQRVSAFRDAYGLGGCGGAVAA